MNTYDYVIVGAGLFGSIFAREASNRKKKVLVIDKRSHIGGNCYTELVPMIDSKINVHRYGPHIFHTNDKSIWRYINQFAEFNQYKHLVKANYNGTLYTLPVNLSTFYQLWGCKTPQEAKKRLEEVKVRIKSPSNLEEFALSEVGNEIYETLFYGYTKKQWGVEPAKLPISIFKRIPIRFTFNDNYYNHDYQGIPIGGYTQIFEKLLKDIDIKLSCDFLEDRDILERTGKIIIYTGEIDEYFNYSLGKLEYRSLEFQDAKAFYDYQGVAQMNFTDEKTAYTRITEHKHFEYMNTSDTIITFEYPGMGNHSYYPINTVENNKIYQEYLQLKKADNIFFGGRLGNYQYLNMDETISRALKLVKELLG